MLFSLVISITIDRLFYEVQESSGRVSVVINCNTTLFATTFNVTITTREYSGDPSTLTAEQSIATYNIGMIIIMNYESIIVLTVTRLC